MSAADSETESFEPGPRPSRPDAVEGVCEPTSTMNQQAEIITVLAPCPERRSSPKIEDAEIISLRTRLIVAAGMERVRGRRSTQGRNLCCCAGKGKERELCQKRYAATQIKRSKPPDHTSDCHEVTGT